jgi:hypothetical protein
LLRIDLSVSDACLAPRQMFLCSFRDVFSGFSDAMNTSLNENPYVQKKEVVGQTLLISGWS